MYSLRLKSKAWKTAQLYNINKLSKKEWNEAEKIGDKCALKLFIRIAGRKRSLIL